MGDLKYKIVYGMGENLESYFKEKGYRNDVSVIINENTYEVYFFLASTIEYEMTKDGYCSFPGLVVLEEISTKNIEVAIEKLFGVGYFSYLTPVSKDEPRFWDKIYYTPR